MARKPFNAPLDKDGPRINELITAPEVLLIDEKGTKIGVVAVAAAIESAENAGLDLVEVSPNTDPPVCKVLDYGKYKYQKQKKRKEAKKKQKTVEIKEIKIRPNIDVHDYQVKLKAMHRFFEDGDKVKVTLRFRGREMAHQELGMDLLMRLQEEIDEVAKVEMPPKAEGRQIVMVMAPR